MELDFFGKQEFENGRMTYSAEGDYAEHWFESCDEEDEDGSEILKKKTILASFTLSLMKRISVP